MIDESHYGRCLDCGDEWVERNEIAICPECHSLNVVEVDPPDEDPTRG